MTEFPELNDNDAVFSVKKYLSVFKTTIIDCSEEDAIEVDHNQKKQNYMAHLWDELEKKIKYQSEKHYMVALDSGGSSAQGIMPSHVQNLVGMGPEGFLVKNPYSNPIYSEEYKQKMRQERDVTAWKQLRQGEGPTGIYGEMALKDEQFGYGMFWMPMSQQYARSFSYSVISL